MLSKITLIEYELEFLIELFVLIYGIIIFTDMKLTAKKYKYILCIIFDIVIRFYAYYLIPQYIIPVGILLLYITVIFIFDENILRKSKYIIALYLTTGVIDIILSLLEQFVFSLVNENIDVHYLFFINYFTILLLLILYGKIKRKKLLYNTVGSNYVRIICGILIVCSGCFYSILQRNMKVFDERLTSFYIICTFAGCIILMFIFVFFIRAERERIYYMYESQLRGTLMESNAEHYKLTLESYKEFRKQRHDFRGHLIVMQNYVNNKNFDLLETYMSELYENYVLSDNSIHVNNEAADSVLNYFANRARQEDMDFRCEGKFRTEISMSSFQLCTCFYNLLNNAIEACRKIKDGERSILVKIKSFRGTFILIVENTVSEPVDKAYWATGLSSKRDASTHGFGLMNVRAVVEELDGRIIFKNIENRFSIEIILPPAAEENFIHMP